MINKNVMLSNAKAAFEVTGCNLKHSKEAVSSFDLKDRAETVKSLTTFTIHNEKIITNLFAEFKGFRQILKIFLLFTPICSAVPRAQGQLALSGWQGGERTYFTLVEFIFAPFKVSRVWKIFVPRSRGRGCSLSSARRYTFMVSHKCLLYLIIEENFFKLTLFNRAVGGPCKISLKKYPGLLLRGFLFLLTANTREDTRRKEGSKKDLRSVVNRWVSPGGSKNVYQPETKRLFLTTESQRTQSFFIKISSLCSLCLCGEKIFLDKRMK
jgi:hypothetical protein